MLIAITNDHESIQLLKVHDTYTGQEMTAVRLSLWGLHVDVVCYYRPPTKYNTYGLTEFIERTAGSDMLICGDMNLPGIDWANRALHDPRRGPTGLQQEFLATASLHNLDQIVHIPTFRSGSTLDLVLSSLVNSPTVLHADDGLSDHSALLIEVPIPGHTKTQPRPAHHKLLYDFNHIDHKLYEDIAQLHRDIKADIHQGKSLDSVWIYFRDRLSTTMQVNIKSKTVGKKGKPWITRQTIQQIRKRRRMHRYWQQKGTEDAHQMSRLQDKLCKKMITTDYQNYLDTKIAGALEDGNSKPLFAFLKQKKGASDAIMKLKDVRPGDNQGMAEAFATAFSSVFTKEQARQNAGLAESLGTKSTVPNTPMPPIDITSEGVIKLLRGLDPRKATGPDNISSSALKHLADHLAPPLVTLMKASLSLGEVPNDWRTAKVIPIYKKGDKSAALNYRPISLTSITSKIMEHIIATNVRAHLDRNTMLTDRQHGFRRNRSCDSQLLITVGDLIASHDENTQTDVVILDFSKAFDVVPHTRLISKLKSYGVTEGVSLWIEAWLRNRTMKVCVEGALSSERAVTSGVPQGSVLGPLLFLVYINDLASRVMHSELRLFADDSLLYKRITDRQDQTQLQDDLTRMHAWSLENDLLFNTTKCETATIVPRAMDTTYTLGGTRLTAVDNFKYLGITISNSLSFTDHIRATAAKANRTLYMMMRSLKKTPTRVKELVYKTVIRSQLEYASQVWSPSTKNDTETLEKINRKAFRWAHRIYKYERISERMQQRGWEPLETRRLRKDKDTLAKIVEGRLEVPLPHLRDQHPHNTRLHATRQKINTSKKQAFFFNRIIEHIM